MEVFVRVLNYCVSFVAFITATALVIFMLIGFITSTYDVVLQMLDTVFLDPADRQAVFNVVNTEFLHTIAVLIILMKAYRILVGYMRDHHIDIKYIVEIAIIACVLELLFNSGQYSEDMRLVLLGLGVAFLAIYAFRYDVLKKAMQDTQALAPNVPTVMEPVSSVTASEATPRKPRTTTRRKIATKK